MAFFNSTDNTEWSWTRINTRMPMCAYVGGWGGWGLSNQKVNIIMTTNTSPEVEVGWLVTSGSLSISTVNTFSSTSTPRNASEKIKYTHTHAKSYAVAMSQKPVTTLIPTLSHIVVIVQCSHQPN